MEFYYHNDFRYFVDEHRFETEIPVDAKYLIIGTFPTHESNSQFEFYYSSNTNIFWPVLADIFSTSFTHFEGNPAIEERMDFLKYNRIGITDMIDKCYRKERSSKDTDLIPIRLRNIFELLDKNKSIDTLILSSRTGIMSAIGLLRTYFFQHNLKFLELKVISHDVMEGSFFRGRQIKIMVPYSTSWNFHKGEESKYLKVQGMYRHCFGK